MTATVLAETEARFRADPSTARSTPTVTATLANGRARLSAGPFNWDADLPVALGGENLAPSPTAYLLGALAGCGVAFIHDTLAPQFDVTIDDDHGDRALLGRRPRPARASTASPRTSPTSTLEIRVSSDVAGGPSRGDARGLARALPDLPRAPQAAVRRAHDRDRRRERLTASGRVSSTRPRRRGVRAGSGVATRSRRRRSNR